jgi:putative aminopeptidase FrvX
MDKRLILIALCLLLIVSVMGINAEESPLLKLAETLFTLPSPTGYEEPMVEFIQRVLPAESWTKRDNLGSFYWKQGKQNSQLAICTPMDESGYFVSGINPEGYLRIDKAVFGPPLIDSYHLGHPMIVWAETGPIEGVLALPSLHILTSEVRREFQESPSLELAYLDIGVSSDDEARKRGIAMLDAVTPWRELTMLAGSKMAGFSLGLKLCTSLVLNAAKRVAAKPDAENPMFVWMAQTRFPVRRSRPRASLGALCASKEIEAKSFVLVDVFPCNEMDQTGIKIGNGPVLVFAKNKLTEIQEKIQRLAHDMGIPLQIAPDHSTPVMVPFLSNHDEVIGLFLPVKFSQTPSEVVETKDLKSLSSLLLVLLQEGGLQ